jgi:hypothetical protein
MPLRALALPDEEVALLKRKLARVKKERDFLRKAAVLFVKESVVLKYQVIQHPDILVATRR